MKKHDILHIISEISESLSLTDKKNLVTETALDSLSETLGVDCSWIQLADPVSKDLYLASSRNFTDEIHNEMAQMYINNDFVKEVVGFGNKVTISQISMDNCYGMEFFKKAGFSSLIAVPILTYKVLGIIGAAYRERKGFSNDFSQLFSVIANLVGMALNKTMITEHVTLSEDTLQRSNGLIMNNKNPDTEEYVPIIDKNAIINNITHSDDWGVAYQKHIDKMSTFHHSHK